MRLQPIARCALRTTDLGVNHLLGDLTTHLRGTLVTAHCGDVEPLVRLHKIDRHTRPRRKDHAKAETIFGVRWFGAPPRHFQAHHAIPRFVSADVPQGPGGPPPVVEHTRSNGGDLRDKIWMAV